MAKSKCPQCRHAIPASWEKCLYCGGTLKDPPTTSGFAPGRTDDATAASARSTPENASIDVEVEIRSPAHGGDELQSVIYQAIDDHLRRDSAVFSADLQLRLIKFWTTDVTVIVTLAVEGRVNNTPIRAAFTHERRVSGHSAAVGGAVGGLVGALVTHAVAMAVQGIAQSDVSGRKLAECLNECIADVMLLIDRTTGRGESGLASCWRSVRWSAYGLALCAVVAVFAVGKAVHGEKIALPLLFWIALINAGAVFGSVHLFGLAFMPTAFFESDPRGRKTLARTGMRNILAMRLVVLFAGLVGVAVFVCSGLPIVGVIK